MPILAAEPDLAPLSLFEQPHDDWFVALTKPRQEKSLARALLAKGIAYFSPTTPRRNRIRGRIVVSRIPLFAGYVFACGHREIRTQVANTSRVVRLLNVPDPERLQDDLFQVWCLTGTGLSLEPADTLDAGTRVRIRRGPMTGLNGRVIRTAGGHRFVVAIDFLGRGVSVQVESDMLTRIPTRDGRRTAGAQR